MTDSPWEDCLLERKTEGDIKDLLKTIVAFANSVKPGHTAVILIGEKDNDTVQGVTNPDKIQKTIRNTCDKIYPPILWKSKVYEKEGKYCVRIEIEYDGETPHFGGAAWVRKGSETIKASDKVFQKLIELRLDKVRELEKWVDKEIAIEFDRSAMINERRLTQTFQELYASCIGGMKKVILMEVNNFWVKFYLQVLEKNLSMSLVNIELSWDDENDCLMLHIKP